MKKLISIIAALAMCTTAAVSASAATIDQTTDTSADTTFTFEYKYDPTYTVTIPSEVQLTAEGTPVEIKAENVDHLDGKKVSVTIAGTDYYRNQMVLSGKTESGSQASMRYQFIMPDESVIETTGGKDQVNGVEVASFTEDGSTSFTVKPVLNGSSSIKKGVTYTGTMTYAVALADVTAE